MPLYFLFHGGAKRIDLCQFCRAFRFGHVRANSLQKINPRSSELLLGSHSKDFMRPISRSSELRGSCGGAAG